MIRPLPPQSCFPEVYTAVSSQSDSGKIGARSHQPVPGVDRADHILWASVPWQLRLQTGPRTCRDTRFVRTAHTNTFRLPNLAPPTPTLRYGDSTAPLVRPVTLHFECAITPFSTRRSHVRGQDNPINPKTLPARHAWFCVTHLSRKPVTQYPSASTCLFVYPVLTVLEIFTYVSNSAIFR